MLNISVENYGNTKIHTRKIGNRRSFWVGMIDLQKGYLIYLGRKYMVFLQLKILQKSKLGNVKIDNFRIKFGVQIK